MVVCDGVGVGVGGDRVGVGGHVFGGVGVCGGHRPLPFSFVDH